MSNEVRSDFCAIGADTTSISGNSVSTTYKQFHAKVFQNYNIKVLFNVLRKNSIKYLETVFNTKSI